MQPTAQEEKTATDGQDSVYLQIHHFYQISTSQKQRKYWIWHWHIIIEIGTTILSFANNWFAMT